MNATCSLKMFISAYLHQIALEIMLLVDKLYEIRITENENREILATCVICNLHLSYMKNALVFSQSEACNFFHVYYYN